jgi:hypothetical protein
MLGTLLTKNGKLWEEKRLFSVVFYERGTWPLSMAEERRFTALKQSYLVNIMA